MSLMSTLVRCALIGLLAATAPAAFADDDAVSVSTVRGEFEVQREEISKEMQPGGRYAEIEEAAQKEVEKELERMASLLEQGPRENLSERQRVELFNAQEKVNTLLTAAAEDSRVKCQRVKKTGSRLATNVCRTVAEWREYREAAREAVVDRQHSLMRAPADS